MKPTFSNPPRGSSPGSQADAKDSHISVNPRVTQKCIINKNNFNSSKCFRNFCNKISGKQLPVEIHELRKRWEKKLNKFESQLNEQKILVNRPQDDITRANINKWHAKALAKARVDWEQEKNKKLLCKQNTYSECAGSLGHGMRRILFASVNPDSCKNKEVVDSIIFNMEKKKVSIAAIQETHLANDLDEFRNGFRFISCKCEVSGRTANRTRARPPFFV